MRPVRSRVPRSAPAAPVAPPLVRYPFGLAGLAVAALLGTSVAPAGAAEKPAFNRKGNLLISDQLNHRVVEADPSGAIVWQFGKGPDDLSSASPLGVRDADRAGDLTLVTATGVAPGATAACARGCPDGRVLLVDPKGEVVWQYGKLGKSGSGEGELDTPVSARYLPGDRILIADQGNHRVIEVERKSGKVVWQHGTGKPGAGDTELDRPGSAELTAEGNVLIADTGNNRAIEVTREHAIVTRLTIGGTAKELASATRVPDTGNYIVTELGHNRIVELDAGDKLVITAWTYVAPGSNPNPRASRVSVLRNGDLLMAQQMNQTVVRADTRFNPIASWGNLNRAGYGKTSLGEGLNAPYDAKVIGETTGLVQPSPSSAPAKQPAKSRTKAEPKATKPDGK